ncbi:uncharacterized protein LOC133519285 isoform X3 [Cydia pomonella]|uniref:uncharacterized protein LOC133519285 isoform X3 n=1 Tax=Cydia pomonella TaxID=82600 RepID=UPI002ADDD243|nr:uncharacterized protein LOC133519285 isoform X3 [Cydia pomonella]
MDSKNRRIIYKVNDKKKIDHDELITKCFEIGSDVEMKEIPLTGEEYLLKVMTERANVAAVTVCDKDITQYAKNQSLFFKEPPGAKIAPDKLKTTIEWQKIQIADFAQVRTSMAMIKTNLLEKGIGKKRVKPIVIQDQSLEGQWIYAFLACSRHPLLSETVSLLRDLARTCAEIRSNIDQEEEDAYMKAAPMNLFICIVARYFEQYDLAD